MREGWYEYVVMNGASEALPGIYKWTIDGDDEWSGAYVGQSKRLGKRHREYHNNVYNLLNGKPYRRGKPTKFRHIHHALLKAYREERRVRYIVFENVTAQFYLNQRERELIAECGTLNR